MHKSILLSVCLAMLCLSAWAQNVNFETLGNVDTIMEDNALTDLANRYSSVQLSFFPEYATRIGFESANNRLDSRNVERDSQALRAFNIVQDGLKQIHRNKLSEKKRTDYDILQARLALDIYQISQNPTAWDPLVYSSVFDALYDLRLKNLTYRDIQGRDLISRIRALPSVAQEASKNLSTPPSFLAQIAMEQAYYAYLSFDEITRYLLARMQDDISRSQMRAEARSAKQAIKDLFVLFKQLAQENTEQDFRMGEKAYEVILQKKYFIEGTPRSIEKYLKKNFQNAQQALLKALSPFQMTKTTTELAAEITPTEESLEIVDIDAADAAAEAAPEPAPVVSDKPAKKAKRKKKAPIVTASPFYLAAKRLTGNVSDQNFISLLTEESKNLMKFFIQDNALPVSSGNFTVREMPAYYGYFKAYFFMPPFGSQQSPSYDVFLRLPTGNPAAKQEMLNRDFNQTSLKLLMAGQLVPGLAYRASYAGRDLSAFRKMYPVPTLQNGWEVYAQHLANERGYIITDEEQLFLAWADYVRAAQALLDFYVHTRRFSYTEAMEWLTEQHEFSKPQAETILKQIAAQPGEAVSYIYGYDALKNLRTKYQKKFGKKFSATDFHSKLMSLGNIPPNRLEAEMEHAYQIEKNHVTQALTTPFYMN